MEIGDIFRLLDAEIFSAAAAQHCVFLWTIDRFLMSAETFMENRGYRRHARFIWNKENGVAPAFTIRFTHEYLLWFYKPRLLAVDKHMRGKIKSVFTTHHREHSRKPDIAYTIVQALYPKLRWIDVFSREYREGWDQWGNQCNYYPQQEALPFNVGTWIDQGT